MRGPCHPPWTVVLVPFILCGIHTGSATAQAPEGWFGGAEVGGYQVHDQSTGFAAAVQAGRQWGPIGLRLSLTHGFGEDSFTTVEPGLQLVINPLTGPLHLLAGAGGGLMFENTLSLPYYLQIGIGAYLGSETAIRAVVRRGSHATTRDSGTFRGPHTITVSVVRFF